MVIDPKRLFRHLRAAVWQGTRAFPMTTLLAIEQEIKSSEKNHVGEIRFVVEGELSGSQLIHGQSARERAIDVFSQLRMWDTEYRNAVLIYLLLADRSVEIIADRGLHVKTDAPEWEQICRDMEAEFRAGRFKQGAVSGIRAVSQLLTRHFPANGAKRNELPDKVVLL